MKTLLTIIFLSLLSSLSWSVSIDVVEREGIYYEAFTDVPFTGEIDGWLVKGSMKNGKKEGKWVNYHSNGQLRIKENYKNGKLDGAWVEFHDDGQLAFKGNYKNGKSEGACVAYYSNGQLRLKGNYKNGESEGAWVGFEEDGRVKEFMTGNFKNGVKISD